MVSKRKLVAIIGVLLAVTLSCIMFTLALLTDRVASDIAFTFSEVKITLSEEAPGTTQLRPGMSISRKPEVTSHQAECYVRAVITVSDLYAGNPNKILDLITFDELNENWYEAEAGTWNEDSIVTVYYKEPISRGETTEPIFDSFTLGQLQESAVQDGIGNKFNINIVVEAVQATVDGETFLTAEDAFNALTAYPAG